MENEENKSLEKVEKKMDGAEEREYIQDYRDKTFEDMLFSQARASELHDKFTGLEVQIATVLLAFAAIFLDDFSNRIESVKILSVSSMKLMYIASIFSLVASLCLGLMHLLRKEKFWDDVMAMRADRLRLIGKYMRKEKTFAETIAYVDGTAACKDDIMRSPKWPWILQTVALFVAVALIVALFSILLSAS